ncbi:MJ1255/VC2487 family glycosyltransferase [Rheinheimera sp.]|uniref:MJ1255/VC2487 family glycosyltransferase n=1 Tax=Rheinheimera sp. TaxID=1869214 RepID=UPI0027BB07FA|nr:MJ1255/VC2487 family glycosyltransferase [Rheinheimera sp.]
MRLLYGVQATGNGHISRARAMAAQLQQHGAKVDFLFSGRAAHALFDMECFGHFAWRRGLTFVSHAGQLNYWQSLQQANLKQLWRDQQQLQTQHYDLVLTDFEPVTAWAARRQGTPCIALGHQYAFLHNIPKQDDNLLSRQVFRYFAPAQQRLGLHWHHFGAAAAIAPPILDLLLHHNAPQQQDNSVLVYLPFEDQKFVHQLLKPLRQYRFDIYAPGLTPAQEGHLHFHPPSHQHFKQQLATAAAVLSNAGFELISEALQLKKKILVKPLKGQMEQASNALALQQLQLAHQCKELTTEVIGNWLAGPRALQQVQYPDVAAALCQQLLAGKLAVDKNNFSCPFAINTLWQQSRFLRPDLLPA